MSIVFGEGMLETPQSMFQDAAPIREALVIQELRMLPKDVLTRFVNGPEGRYLVENEIISGDALEQLVAEGPDHTQEIVVCHMAKENGDERWDELVRHRAEERRLMNELLDSYQEDAKPYVENYRKDFIEKCVPKDYRSIE